MIQEPYEKIFNGPYDIPGLRKICNEHYILYILANSEINTEANQTEGRNPLPQNREDQLELR